MGQTFSKKIKVKRLLLTLGQHWSNSIAEKSTQVKGGLVASEFRPSFFTEFGLNQIQNPRKPSQTKCPIIKSQRYQRTKSKMPPIPRTCEEEQVAPDLYEPTK